MTTGVGQNTQMTIYTFRYWCQKILPAVYDDSLSYYELLCRVVDKLNEVINLVQGSPAVVEEMQANIAELQELFKEFQEHGFDDYYADQVAAWIQDNLEWIFEKVVKQVYFGLTLDGHFVAYIPDGWSDIVFDTGMNYGVDTYGRLILRWDVDDSGEEVNQRPESWGE